MFSPDVWVVDGKVFWCFSFLNLSKLFHNSQKIILIDCLFNLVELYFHVISFLLY